MRRKIQSINHQYSLRKIKSFTQWQELKLWQCNKCLSSRFRKKQSIAVWEMSTIKVSRSELATLKWISANWVIIVMLFDGHNFTKNADDFFASFQLIKKFKISHASHIVFHVLSKKQKISQSEKTLKNQLAGYSISKIFI